MGSTALTSARKEPPARPACAHGSARKCSPSATDILLYISTPGDLIRSRRERLGLSQRSLARRAGTTQAAVSRIERGLTSPGWETLSSLALAMGFEPDLQTVRLRGRWDPAHLAALRERSPAERLALGISANRLAGRMREAGRESRARH